MNKINPLILFSLLFCILLISIYKKNNLQNEYKNVQKEVIIFEQNAQNITNLKNRWNKTNLEQIIKNALQTTSAVNKIDINNKSSFFEIKGTNLSEEEINDLVKKILNSSFEIQKFEFTKASENNISFLAEIVK